MKFFYQHMAAIALCVPFMANSLELENSSAASVLDSANSRLTLSDALRATLAQNPQLVGYQFRTQALAGEQQTAELKPALKFEVDVENVMGSGEYSNASAAEMSLSLASVIELGDQRNARRGVITARQQQLASQQRVTTLDVLAAMTQRFIAVARLQEQLLVQQESLDALQSTLRPLQHQVNAGRIQEADVLRARAAVVLAQLQLQATEQALKAERIKISAFWGETTPSFTRVSADLYALPEAIAIAELMARMDKNPDLELLAQDTRLRAAELQQVQASRAGNLDWRAGIRRLQASDDTAVIMGLSMPLGSGSRASGAISTARAQLNSAQFAQDAAYKTLQAQLMTLAATQQQAVFEVVQLRTQVLPLLTKALQATQVAFNKGRYSFLELNLAQRELLDTRMLLISAAARAQSLQIEIEHMTGAAVSSSDITFQQEAQ